MVASGALGNDANKTLSLGRLNVKLKQQTKAEGAKSTPKAGLRMARGGGKKAQGKAEMAAGRFEPYAEGARKAVAHRASGAWEWAEPRLEHAAETMQETVQKDIAPRVSTALTTAAERSAPAREEALERGTAAFAALKGESLPKQKRRWPMAMLFFLLGGAAGAAGGVFGQRFLPESTLSADTGPDGDSETGGGARHAASGSGGAAGSA